LGKVKTEQVKRLAKQLITRFPDKFTTNFDDNKHLVAALTEGPTTRVRNQVAGYITRTISLTQNQYSDEEDILEEEAE
jgi:small subunit ribosomal protein S17e